MSINNKENKFKDEQIIICTLMEYRNKLTN